MPQQLSAQPTLGKPRQWVLLALLYLTAALWGARCAYAEMPSLLDVFLPMLAALVLVYWCVLDACRRGAPMPRSTWFWFFVAWPLTVPGYLWWSRRWAGLGWIAAHCCGLFAVCCLTLLLSVVVIYGALWIALLGMRLGFLLPP